MAKLNSKDCQLSSINFNLPPGAHSWSYRFYEKYYRLWGAHTFSRIECHTLGAAGNGQLKSINYAWWAPSLRLLCRASDATRSCASHMLNQCTPNCPVVNSYRPTNCCQLMANVYLTCLSDIYIADTRLLSGIVKDPLGTVTLTQSIASGPHSSIVQLGTCLVASVRSTCAKPKKPSRPSLLAYWVALPFATCRVCWKCFTFFG